jgi:hypothetical protein
MLMKVSRLLLVVFLAAASSSLALADGTSDPHMGPIGGTGSIILNSPTDPAFTFSYAAGVTPTVNCADFGGTDGNTCIDPSLTEFVNNSGETWTSLTIDITSSTGGLTFGCLAAVSDPYFTTCASTTLSDGDQGVIFSGTDATHGGILPATSCGEEGCSGPTIDDSDILAYDFSILTDVTDATAQGDSFTAVGTANTVPEPPAIFLVLAGAAVLFLLKRS